MPNFNRPPPPYGTDGQNGFDGQELWVENKSAEGKVRAKIVVHSSVRNWIKVFHDDLYIKIVLTLSSSPFV